jgi:hypothetical protein
VDNLWVAACGYVCNYILCRFSSSLTMFWLVGADGASLRRHVPDFMVKTGSGFRVIDVKPARLASRPEVADVFAWTRTICFAKGWDYQVWTGADAVRYRNLLFIARGRRRFLIPSDLLERVLNASERPSTLGDFIRAHTLAIGRAEVLAVMFHLIWTHRIEVDLSVPTGDRSPIIGWGLS